MKEQTDVLKEKIIHIIAEDEQQPHAHKPFMAKVPVKATPIGYQFHQVQVPDFNPQTALHPCKQRKIQWQNLTIQPSPAVFLHSRTSDYQVSRYLSFVENYFQEKIPDYFLHTSRQRTRSMALRLLHQSNYNYTRAKFFILFPYYLTYNNYKTHQPLQLSNQQMQHKIYAHIQSLKNSKQNDLMKWVKTIQNQMQSRIHISKINTYMQIARQNKYEIPDSIKDIIERSLKIGKQIKRNILNSKNSLQKLQSIKAQLQDNKIVTNQMIHFEQAVARAQEWIKKQNKFQQEYFYSQQQQSTGQIIFTIKQKQFFKEFGKIQYKLIQSLVNEYNSLPLSYPSFMKTTLALYDQTNKLISKLPSLNKAAKTRKSEQGAGIVRIQRKLITQIIDNIEQIAVQHQQFVNFSYTISDGLQQIERISMYLQDTRYEKSLKTLGQYQKLLIDIPIQNDVIKKLAQKIQYYQLIDKLKKDISNPSKYDSLKDQLARLKEKGYENLQHARLEARVRMCMGWHQSQLMIKEDKRIPNRLYILLNEKVIKSRMIDDCMFLTQLQSARSQLNIPEDILRQSELRLIVVAELKKQILQTLNKPQPLLAQLLTLFKLCYQNSITFPQFDLLYQRLTTVLILVAKMHYLLNTSEQINPKHEEFYFTNSQAERIIENVCERRNEMKDLRTKQAGDEIIIAVESMNFPKSLPEWRLFKQFMLKAQQWSDRAMQIIQDFKSNNNMANTREVIDQSRHCLHSKVIQQQLAKIQIALKWRQKIARKMMDQRVQCFDSDDQQFFQKLQKDLLIQEQNYLSQDEVMFRALSYMHTNGEQINRILQKIAQYPTQRLVILKLSQMNKFLKEIDRQIEKYQIKDKVIEQLKGQLQLQLMLNEDWKERYLAIKRFEKKKLGIQQQQHQLNAIASQQKQIHNRQSQLYSRQHNNQQQPSMMLGENNQLSFDLIKQQLEPDCNQEIYSSAGGYIPKAMMVVYSPSLSLIRGVGVNNISNSNNSINNNNHVNNNNNNPITIIPNTNTTNDPSSIGEYQKRKYYIKNGQFCWYYRLLLMLLEFYNGNRLKFVVEQFIKLKNTLTDVSKLIEKYNAISQKSQRTDADYEYLDSQTCKISIFFKQSYLITNKYAQIQSWKNLAQHILKSVPVINMELKARKIEELRELLERKKFEEMAVQHKPTGGLHGINDDTQQLVDSTLSKRRRKPNQLYENDEITLFRDDILISRGKRRGQRGGKAGSSNQSQITQHQHQGSHNRQGKKPSSSSSKHYDQSQHISSSKHHHNQKDTLQHRSSQLKQDRHTIQHLQQLLNNGNLQLMIDDPKQYCICRNGVPNQNSLMVCCEQCNQWFHIECVGIKKHQAKSQESYLCVGCRSLEDEECGYFWDHYQRVTEYALVEIYQQGKSMNVVMSELNKITLVYNAMVKWKEDTNTLLKKLIEQNPMNLSPYEQQIYPLYLQSLWLPTVHYEGVILKRLMRVIREIIQ